MTPNCSEAEMRDAARTFRIARGTDTGILPVQKLNDLATIPTYGSNDAAGMDLYANFFGEEGDMFTLAPGARKLFKTGLSVAIPRGHYGRIAPRSGLAYKHGIDVMAGVVDSDYRGDVGVILINLGFRFDETGRLIEGEDVVIRHGDRIAQFIIEAYKPCLPVPALSLDGTSRGEGGFGSTGK
ncbi:deoxyuridine 5'-triphosphate nucleotidohydrolase [Phaeobacter phage MD18]|nr:deoxyuridine 5'-triphosphate nucleotidohydrolase [Phaeobacter phage MD18]